MQKLKIAIYNRVVNQVPEIKQCYHGMRNRVNGIGRVKAWFYLLWLNVSYYILQNRNMKEHEVCSYYERKRLYTKGSESSYIKRVSPEQLVIELMKYEVISFDVFDTLIFRPFSKPTDLFFLIAHQLEYLDFERIRQEMEQKARELCYAKNRHREITLSDIYDTLEKETGISKEIGIQAEIRTEYEMCFANPYMLSVVHELKKQNKRIIVTSDMYLEEKYIRAILKKVGYPQLDGYYISCDFGKSKSEGSLFDYVKEKELIGTLTRMCHLGDNYKSDVKEAEKKGIKAFYYPNVNSIERQLRAEDMSVITGSLYRGIVNTHLHNGVCEYSREYEFGYVYGGLFVAGYCQFIHDYVKKNGVDKILFLARDGDILMQVYRQMYPQEIEGKDYAYVYWSRVAALKMTACKNKYDYFRRFLYHKVNQGYTLKAVFQSMELEDMLDNFCKETVHTKKKVSQESLLIDQNVEEIKTYLMEQWNQVLKHYTEQLEAGKRYFEPIVQECRKIAAIDIGWAGSGALALDYLFRDVWKFDCDVVGILAGTNTNHNFEPNTSEAQLKSGKLISYLYSQEQNRDLWKLHDVNRDHNLYWELLLSSTRPTFQGFTLNGENVEFLWGKQEKNIEKIREIQKGIMEFAETYQQIINKYPKMQGISGRDAYAAMILIERTKGKYVEMVLEPLIQEGNV